MIVRIFNIWYFLGIMIPILVYIGLYYLLKNKSEKTKKVTLFSILLFALIVHFLKAFIPPYSLDPNRLYRDIWFINICAGNIFLFPFIFLSKNKTAKDYMFYIGIISGVLSLLYPTEPLNKTLESKEVLDVIRFYIHHSIIGIVPLLMVTLNLHKLEYKNVWKVPGCLLLLFLFIILNQIFQSELGFIDLRNQDFLDINYKNTAFVWGPGNDSIGKIFTYFCPKIFKTVPVGEFKGEIKYWPWFWLIVPAYLLVTPLCFLISLIFDFKSFKTDIINLMKKINNKLKLKH